MTQAKNHPKKGSSIKVEPIRDVRAIKRIKKILTDNYRDFCLFTLGINTAYRANEILSIKVRDVAHLNVGDVLEVKQSKVKKYRGVTLNKNVLRQSPPYSLLDNIMPMIFCFTASEPMR